MHSNGVWLLSGLSHHVVIAVKVPDDWLHVYLGRCCLIIAISGYSLYIGAFRWLTLVWDLPNQPYQSLPHGLSDGSELFSITIGEREKGLVALQGPLTRMTTAAITVGGATPVPPAGLCYACTTCITTVVCTSALQLQQLSLGSRPQGQQPVAGHTQCHLPAHWLSKH
jgi:hypothetical protein